MAWLDLKGWSDQLSSVATNAADFTRDVLAEGTTEVSDHETELKITADKVQRLETIIASLKAENDRLAELNSELEENAETSELQINTISSQYRSMVQEKEDEIKLLKEKQNDWQNFQSEDLMVASPPSALATSTSTSSLSNSALQVPGDHDINDLIGAQQEINTLSSELARTQAECEHWRQIAASKQQPKFEVGGEKAGTGQAESLSLRVKELEGRLQREIDQSQHELSALQDAHSQKLKNLTRKHESELEEYKEKLGHLEEELSYAQEPKNEDSVATRKDSSSDKIREKLSLVQGELERTKEELQETETTNASLQSEISRLKLKDRQNVKQSKDLEGRVDELAKERDVLKKEKAALEDMNRENARTGELGASSRAEVEELKMLLQAREAELEEVRAASQQVSSELLATKHRLLASLDDNHASTSAMLKDVRSTRRKVASDANALKQQLFREKQDLVRDMIEIGQKVSEGQRSIDDLEVVSQEVQDETVDLISKMGRTDARDALEENGRLADQVSHLQSQLEDLNATCQSLTSDKEHSESIIAKLNGDISALRKEKGLPDSAPTPKVDVVSGALPERSGDPQLGVEVQSDTQSFDGEFDDSLMFASIKQKYPEAASAMEEQLLQFEEIQKDWEMEKEALEQVLLSVRDQLKQKEQALKDLKEHQNRELSDTSTEEMESKVADLRSQLHTAEASQIKVKGNLELAVKEKDRLLAEINQLQSETEQLTSKVSETEKQKVLLEQQLEESQSNIDELTEELNRTSQELDEKNQSVMDISQTRDELQRDLRQLDLQQEQALSQILKNKAHLQAEVDSMKGENVSLKNKLGETEGEVERLRREIEGSKEGSFKEIDHLKQELLGKEALSEEIESLRRELEKREEILGEVNHLKEELKEKDGMSKEIKSLKEQLEMRKGISEEVDRLKQELEEKEGMSEEMNRLRDELVHAKGSLDEVKRLKQELQDMEATSGEIAHLRKQLEEKNIALARRDAPNNIDQTEAEELKKALATKSEEVETLQHDKDREIDELRQEVDVQKESYERLNESHTILQKCNKLLGEEKNALKKSLAGIGKGGANEGETREVIARMEEECSELRNHCQKIQDRCTELEATLARTQHEKITLREELARRNKNLDKLNRNLTEANGKVGQAEDDARVWQSEKLELDKEIKELNRSITEQSERHQRAMLVAEEEKGSLESEALNPEREKHSEELERKDEEIEELKRRLEDLMLDLSGTKDALNTTVGNNEQLTMLLKEKETDIKSLAVENAFFLEAMNEAKEKEKETKSSQDKAANLERQLEMLNEEKSQLGRRVEELEVLNLTNSDESKTLGLITDLEFEIGDLQMQLKEKEMAIEKLNDDLKAAKKQGESAVKAKEEEMTSKQDTITAIEHENVTLGEKCATLMEQLSSNLEGSRTEAENVDKMAGRLSEKTAECGRLETERKALEAKLKAVQQELNDKTTSDQNWSAQIDDLQKEIDIYDESLRAVQEKRTVQESKIMSLLQELKDKEAERIQLQSEKEAMAKSVAEKEDKAKQLQEEVDNLKNFVQSDINGAQIDTGSSYQDLEHLNGINNSNVGTVQSNLESEPLAISDSEKQLEKMVQEREREIASLKEQNQTAMKLLDDKSRTIMGNSVLVDLHKLQMQKKTLESERHQMVVVLNEKTRECSNLKTEVHKLMKIVSAEKAALEKAQEDYRELVKSQQKPQGEMQKEALQNLSYLIQEKDLEIGALKQKNETLVAVLQASAPDDSSEINKVLEGKEQLEKENKMLKEERDQLVVSIHQKHHESVTYYEEVQRLAGVISQESQKYIDLQKRFDGISSEKGEVEESLAEARTQLEENEKVVSDLEGKLKSQQQMSADLELQLADMSESCQSLEREREPSKDHLSRRGDYDRGMSNQHRGEEVHEHQNGEPVIEEGVFTKSEGSQESTSSHHKIGPEADWGVVDQSDGQSNEAEVIPLETELQAKEEIIRELQSKLKKLETTLADRNERINQKTNESLQKGSEAVILRQQVDIQNQSLLEHEAVVQDKERVVGELQQRCLEKDRAASQLQHQVQSLSQRIMPLETELKTAKEEKQALHESVVRKDAENRSLQDMSNSLAMQVREKEFELGALKEKTKTLTQLVKEREAGSQGDVERMLRETEAMQRQAQMFQQERDQAVLVLQRNDADMAGLRREIQDKSNQEKKLNSELERLRNHLIEMEDSYMSEALQAEEREKQLRDRLTHAEENLRTNSTAVQSASQEASNQIENLLDQLASATNEKEQVLMELAAAQEQSQQYSTALENLQMVLEQFQQDWMNWLAHGAAAQEESQQYSTALENLQMVMAQFQQEKEEIVAQEVEIYQKRAEEKEKIAEHLFRQNMDVQQKLSDTQEALESASRLTEQMDRKEEAIARLRDEISRKDEDLSNYKKQFEEVSSAAETKVDKPLVKNLFINYVNAPAAKRDEVTHLITSLLNFSKEEHDRLSGQTSGGWLSGIFGGSRPAASPPSTPRSSNPHEKSFSQQFVKFLEEESTPSIKVRLPVEEMTKDRTKPSAFNPFSAPVPSQSPFIHSSPPAKQSLGTLGLSSSQAMVNPIPIAPSVPQPARITPVPPTDGGSGRNSPATAKGSLRDVLQ